MPPIFGHCPNCNYPPSPPHSNRHSGALFFWRDFTIFYHFYHFLPFLPLFTIFSLNKCPKPSGQGFRPPQNQANARLNLENSSLKKCPKPSGQGFRPPPPNGQCPNRGGDLLKGASLSCIRRDGTLKVHLYTHRNFVFVFWFVFSFDKQSRLFLKDLCAVH